MPCSFNGPVRASNNHTHERKMENLDRVAPTLVHRMPQPRTQLAVIRYNIEMCRLTKY